MTASSQKKTPVQLLQEFSAPLIAGVISALLWANHDPDGYQAFLHWSPFGHDSHLSVHFFVNDIFMALFFGIATKEIAEACLPDGALNPPRKAVNPLLGTLGGVLGPVGVYVGYMALIGDWSIQRGWGVPTATDIAMAWLIARVAFGPAHPAVSFLLLLAVADDAIGLAIIAIFYGDPAHPVEPVFLLLVGLGIFVAWRMKRAGTLSFWPYLLIGGGLSWAGLFLAHLHPALALVPIVPFMPHAKVDHGLFVDWDGPDTMNHFEHVWKTPVDLGLFAFGLANAGVRFSSIGSATWGVLLALLLGKTVGIYTFSSVARRLGFPLPDGMDRRSLLVAGMVAGLGLTVALFVAGVAFTDPVTQGAAKMGALMSIAVAPIALAVRWGLGVKRKH